MRSSRDVLHRLLHDPALSLSEQAIVGYLDRFKGILELPVQKFQTAHIPFHRIEYFRHGSEVIWHKQTRLDVLFQSTDHSRAFTTEAVALRKFHLQQAHDNRLEMEEKRNALATTRRRARPSIAAAFSGLMPVPVHYCSVLSAQWVSATSLAASNQQQQTFNERETEIRVATYNVLHDHHLPEQLKSLTPLRWEALARQVQQNPAHFWVFTEATPQFASFLLHHPFVRERFSSSDSEASLFQTLAGEQESTGQLVLIRRDIAVQAIFYTSTHLVTGKRLVFILALMASGLRVALSAVHLTSGQLHQSRSVAAVEKRRQQLEYILSKLNQLQSECDLHIIAGDFNYKGKLDEDMGRKLLEHYIEADHSFTKSTYDPVCNSLAALNSNETTPMRLDRIYLRLLSKKNSVRVQTHQILGKQSTSTTEEIEMLRHLLPKGLHPSDHFGVITTFAVKCGAEALVQKVTWSTASALAVVPEEEIQQLIDNLWRAEHDPSYGKWPPHINVLYPFVNEEAISQVCSSIRKSMILQPFNYPSSLNMDLSVVESFKHKSSHTIYLSPADNGFKKLHNTVLENLVKLHDMELACFTQKGRVAYTPHLTIAKLKGHDRKHAQDFIEKTRAQVCNTAVRLGGSHSYSLSVLRRMEGRMVVVDRIPLPISETSDRAQRSFEWIKSVAREIFGEGSDHQVIPVGSFVLLGEGLFSDIDVVILPSRNSNKMRAKWFFEQMQSLLSESVGMRLISEARCPIISVNVRNQAYLPIDIIFGEGEHTEEVLNDSAALHETMKLYEAAEQSKIKAALLQLKIWAESKLFSGRAFNLFPGLTWPVALFSQLADSAVFRWTSWRDILIRFFTLFHEINWKISAVSLSGIICRESCRFLNGRDCQSDKCVIIAPGSPCNVAEFVVSAVLDSFAQECERALTILNSKSWEKDWIAYSQQITRIDSTFQICVDIVLRSPFGFDTEVMTGWLKGKIIGIVEHHFESKGIALRPANEVRWSKNSIGSTSFNEGFMTYGINTELTTLKFSAIERNISMAEKELSDKFLRWEYRPPNSTISMLLRRLGAN